tara:strand:+ start:136 stop:771 length:636 start_codon:yes stop_codon:yes gene_type:complete
MRTTIFISIIISIGVWIAAVLIFYGILPLPAGGEIGLSFPETTSEAGDSLVAVEGIFSSVAVVLALIAVLLQGRELKASTFAQREQAAALQVQSSQQIDAIKMQAHSVRLQFLLSEIERLGNIADKTRSEIEECDDTEEKRKKWDLVRNSRNKQNRYREECEQATVAMEHFLKVKGVQFPSDVHGSHAVGEAAMAQRATASGDTSGRTYPG